MNHTQAINYFKNVKRSFKTCENRQLKYNEYKLTNPEEYQQMLEDRRAYYWAVTKPKKELLKNLH